jgi:hypothetical protein
MTIKRYKEFYNPLWDDDCWINAIIIFKQYQFLKMFGFAWGYPWYNSRKIKRE